MHIKTPALFIYLVASLVPTTTNGALDDFNLSAECLADVKSYDLEDYLNPFWFVEEFYSEAEIGDVCTFETAIKEGESGTLNIDCKWGETSLERAEGKAYSIVEAGCNRKGGLMYLAHSLRTEHGYTVEDFTDLVKESSIHHNVPICLPPRCKPEKEFFDQVIPCSHIGDGKLPNVVNWTFKSTDERDNDCPHEINIAHTNLDDECKTKWTYDHHESPCDDDLDNSVVVCNYSDPTKEDNTELEPEFCDFLGGYLYKYSYGLKGTFTYFDDNANPKEVDQEKYSLNIPTCLKKECDAIAYYKKTMLPYLGRDVSEPDEPERAVLNIRNSYLAEITDIMDVGITLVSEVKKSEKGKKGKKKKSKEPKKTKGPKKTKKPKKLKRI